MFRNPVFLTTVVLPSEHKAIIMVRLTTVSSLCGGFIWGRKADFVTVRRPLPQNTLSNFVVRRLAFPAVLPYFHVHRLSQHSIKWLKIQAGTVASPTTYSQACEHTHIIYKSPL